MNSETTNSVMLEVNNLHKNFGEVRAVRDLNFTVQKGEIFGFLGPNGAGKTTTMRMVTCYIPPTSGRIAVGGFATHEYDMEVRKRIGYLPENNPLYYDMKVSEYLDFVGRIRGLQGAQLTSRLDEMYQVCGLTEMTGRPIGNLSKGYRQRVGLAQAMIHNPELLILDEPMSGLDPNQIIEIRQLIKKVGKEKTVIYCSHILSEVSATCSRILIINNGIIVASGTPDELTSKTGQGNRYLMRVKTGDTELESKIQAVPEVSSVTLQSSEEQWHTLYVMSSGGEHIGEKLFQCAVDNSWVLSELKREIASLEDVFMQLTRG
jgi:ABC-2 type transport system ATP-binding protein